MNVQLRSPKEIMKLSRLGCFHQSKLSFLRSFLEEFKDWKYSRDLFELDKDGYGKAIYSFSKNKKTFVWQRKNQIYTFLKNTDMFFDLI